MLKTCFGCCPLHHGVSAIALINIVWNITEALKHIYHRNEQYERFKWVINSNGNTSVSPDDNSTAEDESVDYWSDVERIPVMSGIYMDYVFIITISWVVLEFISNCCLKQSTFKVSPEKIYAWLVIYYSNLCSGIIFLIFIIFNMTITEDIEYFMCFLEITIIAVEIYIVQSYYKQQKLAAISDFVHLKWKYVPKPKTQSDENRSTIYKIPENLLTDQTEDQSSYIPIFVRDLRRANS
ncbi:PREDICTED: uncharacterized protein LOC107171542 [Diuraphis noxia]|uniref:uncharacterized protein LOC107171542 n=1 Tax=Diuraphis noxia TaxID=143948 RepID=UPI000763B99B|nr:PREDICTED: uncharacterized protein LOC107171542 [Diuraphis noxia]